MNLGIDFSAGTRVDIDSDTKLSQPKVERTMKDMGNHNTNNQNQNTESD
jgi:SecD/SecF fusion protein